MTSSVTLLDPETIADPYPLYAALRTQPPRKAADLDVWLVSAYDDVAKVLLDTETYVNADAIPASMLPSDVSHGPPSITHRLTMLNHLDSPAHERVRGLSRKLFTQRAIKQSEEMVRRIATDLVDKLPPEGEVDLVAHFARPMPTMVIAEMLGIPPAQAPKFIEWSDAVVAYLSGSMTPDEHLDANTKGEELYTYFETELLRRSKEPGEPGILSDLALGLRAGDTGCDLNEIVSLAVLFLVGGNETTAHAIWIALSLLMQVPEYRAQALTDRAFLTRVCDEAMRLESPTQGLFRRTTKDVELGGVAIPAGERLIVLFASANRDENVFDPPTEADPERANLRRSMTFGWGVHRCLGEHLAKMEVEVAVQTLLERYPDMTHASGHVSKPWQVFFLKGSHEWWVDLGKPSAA